MSVTYFHIFSILLPRQRGRSSNSYVSARTSFLSQGSVVGAAQFFGEVLFGYLAPSLVDFSPPMGSSCEWF